MDNIEKKIENNSPEKDQTSPAINEITLEDVKKCLEAEFDSLDRDSDGFLSDSELLKGLNDSKYGSKKYNSIFAVSKHTSEIEELSNDEWGDENDGITRLDLKKIFNDPNKKASKNLKTTIDWVNTNGEKIADLSSENAQVASAARAIRNATRRDNLVDTGTDEEAIQAILNNLDETDRGKLKVFYSNYYDTSLKDEFTDEMSGLDLDRSLNLLNRKDNLSDDAGFIHEMLLDHESWFGRSERASSKAIRDKLSTMSASDIERADQEFKTRYNTTLRDALMQSDMNASSKESLDIHLKGADKRTSEDKSALAEIALKAKDIELFEEAMRYTTPEERKAFTKEDMENNIRVAFAESSKNMRHAFDYAKHGKLSVATLVRENTTWIGDNEKAIENALEQMSDEERVLYNNGKKLSRNEDLEGLSSEDKNSALSFYKDLNFALDKAGNSTELLSWEDQIDTKHGTLVRKLAGHRGTFSDSPMDDILHDLESMEKEDWQKLKEDKTFRGRIEEILDTFLNKKELGRVKEILEHKESANTYEESLETGKRSVVDVIKDNRHRGFLWLNTKEENIYSAIEEMSEEEKRRYREDTEFKKELDSLVARSLDFGVEEEIARAMLKRVSEGSEPEMDIFDKLGVYSRHLSVDEAKVIREVEGAFTENPEILERVKNPVSDEDRVYSQNFHNRLRLALGEGDYFKYGAELLKYGHLSIEKHIELNKSWLGTDKKGLLEYLKQINAYERARLSGDDGDSLKTRQLIYEQFSSEDRELARTVLEQSNMKPEDYMKSFVTGAGVSQEEMMEILEHLNPEAKLHMSEEYSRKYGGNATIDFLDRLKSRDLPRGEIAVETVDKTFEQKYSDTIFHHSKVRDGFGRSLVDAAWDGTGYQADMSLSGFAQAVEEHSRTGVMPAEAEQDELRKNVVSSLESFSDSKKQMAESMTDAAIAAAAIGGACFTGGVSLSLLAKGALAGAAGAAIKIGGKAAVMGSDYEWDLKDTALDGGRGFLFASTAFLGPGELAHAFKIGSAAGKQATAITTSQLNKIAFGAGSRLLKEGAEEGIERGMTGLIRHALVSGSHKISMQSVKTLAFQSAAKGNEAAVTRALYLGLSQTLKQETGRAAAKIVEYGLPTLAGTISGGASGTLLGVSEMDRYGTPEAKLSHVAKTAGMSAGIGALFSLGFKVSADAVTTGSSAVKSRLNARSAYKSHTGNEISEKATERLSDKLTEVASERVSHIAEAAEHVADGMGRRVSSGGHLAETIGELADNAVEQMPYKVYMPVVAGGNVEQIAGRANRLVPVSDQFQHSIEETVPVDVAGLANQ